MFCSECGKQVEDNAKFCGECGTVQSNIEQTPKAELNQVTNVASSNTVGSFGISNVAGYVVGAILFVGLAYFTVNHFSSYKIKTNEQSLTSLFNPSQHVRYYKLEHSTISSKFQSNPFEVRKKLLGKYVETKMLIGQFTIEGTKVRIADSSSFTCLMDKNEYDQHVQTGAKVVKGVVVEWSDGIELADCKYTSDVDNWKPTDDYDSIVLSVEDKAKADAEFKAATEAESMRTANGNENYTVNQQADNSDVNKRSKVGNVNKEYFQLFVCLSEEKFLPVANDLAKTLLGYAKTGETVAYRKLIEISENYFRGSIMGECTHMGIKVNSLPDGEMVFYGENNEETFWLLKTRGIGGGGLIGLTKSK